MRINLYFPDDHELNKVPKKQRTQYTKALIEHALIHKERVDQLEHTIKKLLETVILQSDKIDVLQELILNTERSFAQQQRNSKENGIMPISEFGLIDQIKKFNNK